MLTRFLDTTAVDGFATWVADELHRRLPPETVEVDSPKSVARRDELDRRIRERALRFVNEARPNLYQKAKLGTRLQDQLRARGYRDPFVRTFSLEIVKLVAGSSVPVPK